MLWSAIQIILLVYFGLAALIYFRQASMVFLPDMDRELVATPASIGLKFSELSLTTTDGLSLHGWLIPAKTEGKSRGLVVFLHGNAGNISHRLDYLGMFHELGLASLIIDYRGYGRSGGTASEEGTYLDADTAWHQATQVLGFPSERIVVFGESLGGGVAAYLAATRRPGALVLASTFTSVPDLGADLYPLLPVRLLARIRYDTLARLSQITCPVMVIHSPSDTIIPYAHGQRLFEAAQAPKEFLRIEGDHNEGFVFGRKEWTLQLDAFLRRSLP